MRKLYENFHIFNFQKRIVSAETIRGNTVNIFPVFLGELKTTQFPELKKLKLRCSEKATKFGPSFTYNLTLLIYVKQKKWKIGQILVAFSEYLNFTCKSVPGSMKIISHNIDKIKNFGNFFNIITSINSGFWSWHCCRE